MTEGTAIMAVTVNREELELRGHLEGMVNKETLVKLVAKDQPVETVTMVSPEEMGTREEPEQQEETATKDLPEPLVSIKLIYLPVHLYSYINFNVLHIYLNILIFIISKLCEIHILTSAPSDNPYA